MAQMEKGDFKEAWKQEKKCRTKGTGDDGKEEKMERLDKMLDTDKETEISTVFSGVRGMSTLLTWLSAVRLSDPNFFYPSKIKVLKKLVKDPGEEIIYHCRNSSAF